MDILNPTLHATTATVVLFAYFAVYAHTTVISAEQIPHGRFMTFIVLVITLPSLIYGIHALVTHPAQELTPKVVKTYTLNDVDISKKSSVSFDITEENLGVWKHTQGRLNLATQAYKGGTIIDRKTQKSYKIDEVRESKSVKEPVFQIIEKKTVYHHPHMKDNIETTIVLVIPTELGEIK